MAAEHWFRWHHGTVTDPKWRVVSRRASHAMSRNVTVGHVLSVWSAMLECASQADPRGELVGWDDEDIGVALDVPTDEVAAIREAMQRKTLDGNVLSAWNTRQPKREDNTAARRKSAQRQRENEGVTSRDNVECHAMSRNVTTETETETETETDKAKAKAKACPADTGPGSAQRFAEWWAVYPRHENRKKAETAWRQKRLDGKADELIADVERRKAGHRTWREGVIMHPTTYLNGERWCDEIDTSSPRNPEQRHAASSDFDMRRAV